MRVADLTSEVVEQICTCDYDRIIEKHEGPESWDAIFRYGYNPEFIDVNGLAVLLPVDGERLANISVIRCIVSRDGDALTIFLKDTTLAEAYNVDPDKDIFYTGFMAFCEKFPGQEFYLATVYHEWFIVENEIFVRLELPYPGCISVWGRAKDRAPKRVESMRKHSGANGNQAL